MEALQKKKPCKQTQQPQQTNFNEHERRGWWDPK